MTARRHAGRALGALGRRPRGRPVDPHGHRRGPGCPRGRRGGIRPPRRRRLTRDSAARATPRGARTRNLALVTLPRSTPSAQGVDAAGILAFVDAAERDNLGLHSLMVVRHGHVVAEGWWRPYAADRVHLAYSLSKTVTATAVGFLVAGGSPLARRPRARPLPGRSTASARRARLGGRARAALPVDDGRPRGGRLGPGLRPA